MTDRTTTLTGCRRNNGRPAYCLLLKLLPDTPHVLPATVESTATLQPKVCLLYG
jgi:hypothetical protein